MARSNTASALLVAVCLQLRYTAAQQVRPNHKRVSDRDEQERESVHERIECMSIVSIGSLIRLALAACMLDPRTHSSDCRYFTARSSHASAFNRPSTHSSVPSLFSGDINYKPCTRMASPQRTLRTHPNCMPNASGTRHIRSLCLFL